MLVQRKATKRKDPPETCPSANTASGFPALLASVGLARRHIPVPLARSRSRREPLTGLIPPSAAMLGGVYGEIKILPLRAVLYRDVRMPRAQGCARVAASASLGARLDQGAERNQVVFSTVSLHFLVNVTKLVF